MGGRPSDEPVETGDLALDATIRRLRDRWVAFPELAGTLLPLK